MQGIAILGSTGSIGKQTLEVIEQFPERLQAVSLVAGENFELLAQQVKKYHPKIAVIAKEELLSPLKALVGDTKTVLLAGEAGIKEALEISEVTTVLAAISGSAGLKPTLQAIKYGKKVALANKETLVTAGHIVMENVQEKNVQLLPVDSEHSAIFQCLANQNKFLEKLILTASGGPFRGWPKERLAQVTPEMALKHPNWSMGSKITIDSATLINKGLEVIEAHWLFNMPYDRIEVIIHPQSIIHSMIMFKDTSVIAQMGYPDMRLPILYAISWPERWSTGWDRLDFSSISGLTFEKPDYDVFPGLKLAYEVGAAGGTAPTIFNAANEKAVELFLNGRIKFPRIVELIEFCLQYIPIKQRPSLEEILELDLFVRKMVDNKVKTDYF
ncbi:MAG: 1-deoxy-D-xylulose-5-phosphate reductoisomerase [Zhaonellaceae bacterium]|nr:1-deoxy-D-xylulose-5-phosphate reductoisomerase [Clostridia bacterium]